MKKLIKSIAVIIFVIFLVVIAILNNSPSKTEGMSSSKTEGMEFLKYGQLATLPINQTYDYEDVLKDMKANELATEKRTADFKAQNDTNTKLISFTSTGTVRYAKFTMDPYTFTRTFKKYELTPVFYVGLYYTSELEPDKMISIAEPYIKTSGGAKCVFNGNIFYKLENGHSLYYGVAGDVYKTANTTITGGVEIGIGVSNILKLEVLMVDIIHLL
jgi:hypothetical protein